MGPKPLTEGSMCTWHEHIIQCTIPASGEENTAGELGNWGKFQVQRGWNCKLNSCIHLDYIHLGHGALTVCLLQRFRLPS